MARKQSQLFSKDLNEVKAISNQQAKQNSKSAKKDVVDTEMSVGFAREHYKC